MKKLVIRGGTPLAGSMQVAGAKNAALPILAATLLAGVPVRLRNVPNVTDILSMLDLLRFHGVTLSAIENGTLDLDAADLRPVETPYEIVRRMRASFLVLTPLLVRFGHARLPRPGGCSIGTRPIDLHLDVLRALGAQVEFTGGIIDVRAPQGLRGARVNLPFPSVGATHAALMGAAGASGETEIANAAREPEIVDLAAFLAALGARVEGAGTHRILVEGAASFRSVAHTIIPDRVETGSYIMAGAITGGEVEVIGGRLEHIGAVCAVLERCGVRIYPSDRGLMVSRSGPLASVDLDTEVFPGFPTDLQAQFMAMMCLADGVSVIRDCIFEARFMHVPELQRLGADIRQVGSSAVVTAVPRLNGAEVMATDLRASMSLVLAGLAARGETTIHRIYHLDRGFEDIDKKLQRCGADIERLEA